MPIYEYRCQSCGETFEVMRKVDEKDDYPSCQEVGCTKMGKEGNSTKKRIMSASSFRLKGTGWYQTDYKGKK